MKLEDKKNTMDQSHNHQHITMPARQDLGGLGMGALALGITGIIVAVVAKTGSDLAAQQVDLGANVSSFHNVTNNVQQWVPNFTSNFSVLGTILGLSAVVGLLVAAFMLFKQE